mmetsp:Transcript_30006/g.115185  ORF Transcript_30006/g.115185 Transcript_30006/m.115185 type:complete len:314 (+) Transcript_30006:349-1290(+)
MYHDNEERFSSIKITSEFSTAVALRKPKEQPTVAPARAGASFTPSPTINTLPFEPLQPDRIFSFSLGDRLACTSSSFPTSFDTRSALVILSPLSILNLSESLLIDETADLAFSRITSVKLSTARNPSSVARTATISPRSVESAMLLSTKSLYSEVHSSANEGFPILTPVRFPSRSTVPSNPHPGKDRAPETSPAWIPLFLISSSRADAIGCTACCSRAAAVESTHDCSSLLAFSSSAPENTCTPFNLRFPVVSVPVLSKTTWSTAAVRSRVFAPPFTRTPLRAHTLNALRYATGAPRTNAQGLAAMSTPSERL